jgi:hypothetical protein
MKHLGQSDLRNDEYHLELIRRDLTRNLVALFPDVYDEVSEAFKGKLAPRSQ